MLKIPADPFVLVDGSSYLFRAFHALPPLTNSKGQPTGAIYGVVNMLRKLLSQFKPAHVAVVFDCKEKTFRHDMYPEYKANRVAMPEELAVQIEPLQRIIRAMGLPLIAIPGVEADDVIGTLAYQASAAGMFTVISTSDKDMAQLVNDKILLVNTMSETILDREGVIKKFEVTPEQMIDYLSLIGDPVDNVPGVYKVGPKTAVKWLQAYQTMDNLVQHAHEIAGKVGENLRNTIKDLPLFRELITIKTDVPLTITPQQLQQHTKDVAVLQEQFSTLEFRNWLKQLSEQNGVSDSVATEVKTIATTKALTDYQTILTHEELAAWIEKIIAAPYFAFDVMANNYNYMDAEIVGIAFAIENAAAYVPIDHNYIDAPDQLALTYVLDRIKPLLENPQQIKVCHDLKYNIEVMAKYGINMQGNNFDTMLASYTLNSVASKHTKDVLAAAHLNREIKNYEDVTGKGAKQVEFGTVAVGTATQFAAEDVDVTLELYREFQKRLANSPGQEVVFNNIEMPLVAALATMERRGVLIDIAALNAQSVELGASIAKFEQEAYTLAGEEFNLGSPKQLQEILFNKLKLPVIEKTPTGQPSTGEAVLQELAEDYLLPKIILEYRTLSKLKSTYTDKLPLQVNAHTGRVHTSYQQAVTATGRLSSTDPNLQNIPIRTVEGKKIRAAFIAPPGYKIVSADYSQIELRIMAHLSQDAGLLNTFAEGLDVHRATASEVFSTPKDEVTEDQRRHAKAINFGLIYGMSAFGLAKQLGIDRLSADLYINTYFERFPGVKRYMESTRQQAAEQGFVETLYGRRLYLPDIRSSKQMLRKAAERAAINAPLQGAQSDIIKIAMIRLHHWLQTEATDAHMIMQVHDELVFEIPDAKVGEYSLRIANIMMSSAELSVQLEVGIDAGPNWDEAH